MTASRIHANIIAANRDLVERHEGRRQFPYLDTRGKTTIGIGLNLSDRGLADDEIEYLFANDLGIALSICCGSISGFSPARQAALISMAFNLGRPRLTGFRRLRVAINRGNHCD
jgi:lysozyme